MSSAIPQPTQADGFTAAELRERARQMAILAVDPRTRGSNARPTWLVELVVRQHDTNTVPARWQVAK